MIIRSIDNSTDIDAGEVGGKGKNLLYLHQAGFNVPPFLILPTSWFGELRNADDVRRKAVLLSEELDFLKGSLLAVRSSATAEDSKQHSFAGQFKTELNVSPNSVADAVVSVWSSKNTDTVRTYVESSGVRENIEMAVIIQQMIQATSSGVAFGMNPLTGDGEEKIVNAIRGLGEALVSGESNADRYTIKGGRIEKKIIGQQPVLSDGQLAALEKVLNRLQSDLQTPQDVEFSFADEELFILQCRPVTTQRIGQKIIWDNSNIVESYPGLTLPLTFSFIEKMYEAVYRQFSLVLGVSKKRVDANSEVYANMLGILNGRVYYNLNSWYRSLAELPGYSVNAEFMEKMMGVKEKPGIELPARGKAGIADYWQIVRAIIHIGGNRFSAKKQKDEFVCSFDSIYSRFDKKDFTEESIAAIFNDYKKFEQMMVLEWKAPLVNDFFAMIYFGLLQKICTKNIPSQNNIHNELVASSKDIVTTEPLRLLPQIARKIASNKELEHLFLHSDAHEVWRILQQPAYSSELRLIREYLSVWGERTVAELKLETITYQQQPARLIALLQSYIREKLFEYRVDEDADRNREKAEEMFFSAFKSKPVARRMAKHVLEGARYFISNRENLRYYRTRGFGMVRKIFMALGEKMAEEGLLKEQRDIFYLELPELESVAAGNFGKEELHPIINARKEKYILFKSMPLPERIVTYGVPEEFIIQPAEESNGAIATEWQGIPCSAGVVRARVRKLREADEITSMDQQILATYATDPGWVVLFPSASGIITERGSLLSHAAIVSREMGIPCIVGVSNLMESIEDGAEIIMDGSTGVIRLLKSENDERD